MRYAPFLVTLCLMQSYYNSALLQFRALRHDVMVSNLVLLVLIPTEYGGRSSLEAACISASKQTFDLPPIKHLYQ